MNEHEAGIPDFTQATAKELIAALRRDHTTADHIQTIWKVLLDRWDKRQTHDLVVALIESGCNAQIFLAELLRAIYTKFLGEDVSVVGTYRTRQTVPNTVETADTFSGRWQRMIACGWYDPHKKRTKEESKFVATWGYSFEPPSAVSWRPASIRGMISSRAPAAGELGRILSEAKALGQDIDYVLSRAIPLHADGLIGLGKNTEARAYIFSYISSLYNSASGPQSSPEISRLLKVSRNLPSNMRTEFVRQMYPILNSLSLSDTWHTLPEKSDISSNAAIDTVGLPCFWYFLIHLATTGDAGRPEEDEDVIINLLFPLWTQLNRTVRVPPALDVSELNQSCFIAAIMWMMVGGLSKNQNSYDCIRGLPFFWESLSCARLPEVDNFLENLGNAILWQAWKDVRRGFMRLVDAAMKKSSPSNYKKCPEGFCSMIIQLFIADSTVIPDDSKPATLILLVRQFAMCGDFARGFQNSLVKLDSNTAKTVLSAIIKLLGPYPTEEERADIQSLQETYATYAYEDPADLPPHLVDRFISSITELARHDTTLAEALIKAGIVSLVSVIRDERYEYPPAEDVVPPHVRKIFRERMCEDAFNALQERTYLTAQKRLLYENPVRLPAPSAPASTMSRHRGRPSWMATGG